MAEESTTATVETSESVNTSPAPEPATTTGGTVEEWDGHFEPPKFDPDDYDLTGEASRDAEPEDKPPADDDDKSDSGRQRQKPEAQDTGDGETATAGPDESLKARAMEAGLSETEIAAFEKDVAGLERTLNLIDRASIRELRKAREAAQQNGRPADDRGNDPPQQQQQQPPASPTQGTTNSDDDFVPSDAWDEESRSELVKLHNHHKARHEKLVSAFRSELQRRDEALMVQSNVLAGLVTELALDGLGQDPLWKDVVASPENRNRIRDAALDLAAVQQQRGKPLDPANLYAQMRAMVRRGAAVEFGQDIEQQAIRKVRQQARDEATGRFTSTVPPQGRRSREPGDSLEDVFAKSRELDRRMGLI